VVVRSPPFDVPGATFTTAIDINSEGAIVGRYNTADGRAHGFKLRAGQFTNIDVSGSILSFATGINPEGDIVGKYQSPDGKFHGFLLTGKGL
jgi:probable HAF family extracellular repeat protein